MGFLYVGTYASEEKPGIYVFDWDSKTGYLSLVGQEESGPYPSYLALHPNKRYLYAVNEVQEFQGQRTGAVAAFAINATTGHLTLLNRQATNGEGPCYLSLDHEGKTLFVANYGGGSIAGFPIKSDGSLEQCYGFFQQRGTSIHHVRQINPHAQFALVEPEGKSFDVWDLGLDKILIY